MQNVGNIENHAQNVELPDCIKCVADGRIVDDGRQTWFIIDGVSILEDSFILADGVIIWYARIE